ncbi:MAG: Lrp/AsnC family transcriptional regulator [Nitrosopumilus sp.]|nr:Lrp/AsnC family transcriptional regulator [Nitrosopumilus sp.]MDH3489301.1 Lrp/AsnC family transcriptional regulator [Nitrosopumilus sp.]MDH3516299.1 Lrp/AsnC family transcriptional regulator [Nitrosopumilus sp.]MDH3564064.1 Lrp/AsnC family transcriptional regulator [Nitrosopumilus sp.]MDH5417438.1 Lrp/AsnC family transcriptional regulator [Nitrosopumilus sp.]
MNTAFVLVNCDMGYEMQTVKRLKELCDEVQGTYGLYDFICKLKYDSIESFEQTLQNIRRLQNITHTITIHTIPEQS